MQGSKSRHWTHLSVSPISYFNVHMWLVVSTCGCSPKGSGSKQELSQFKAKFMSLLAHLNFSSRLSWLPCVLVITTSLKPDNPFIWAKFFSQIALVLYTGVQEKIYICSLQHKLWA